MLLYAKIQLMNGSKIIQNIEFLNHMQQGFFSFAIKHDFIQNNPMKLVEVPRKIDVPTDEENENFYTKEELIQFLNCAKDYGNYQAFTFFQVTSI